MNKRPDPFEAFYRKRFWWVCHAAAPIVGRRDAKDVAQEVFVRAALAHERGEFDPSKPALAYLRMATFWAAQDHLRRLRGERPAAEDEDNEPMDETLSGDPDRALAVRRAQDDLAALLEALPPERRIVWVMSCLHRMTQVEIAETLEISPNTVNKRLHLARADFDAALARKRAAEKRTRADAGALLLLPLDADAIARMARSLPADEVSAATHDDVWRRIQKEVARRRAQGDATRSPPIAPPAAKPPSEKIGPRLKPKARQTALLALGAVIGLLAAAAVADTRSAPPSPADPPHAPVAASPTVAAPPTVDSVEAAPTGSVSTPIPAPHGSSDPDLQEMNLLMKAEAALDPTRPSPEVAMRLLDRYAELYPESRRFAIRVARLRREAQRLIKQKR